jgi:hypothetical protein
MKTIRSEVYAISHGQQTPDQVVGITRPMQPPSHFLVVIHFEFQPFIAVFLPLKLRIYPPIEKRVYALSIHP